MSKPSQKQLQEQIEQSRIVFDNAFTKGLLPTAIYTIDANNEPQMIPLISPEWTLSSPGNYKGTFKGPIPTELGVIGSNIEQATYVEQMTYITGALPKDSLKKSFETFRTVFNSIDSYNPHSDIAETYAISLALEGKFESSINMFNLITNDAKNIETVIGHSNRILPVVNKKGLLGYEGIYQFAEACLEKEERDKAEKLYNFIASLERNYDGKHRFFEVRESAIKVLVHVFNRPLELAHRVAVLDLYRHVPVDTDNKP